MPQHATGSFVDRTQNRLLLAIGRDPVGALRGARHAHGDVQDRDYDDNADRQRTNARLVPARPVRFPSGLYLRRRQHFATFAYLGRRQDSEQKLANDTQFAAKITDVMSRRAAAIGNNR